MNKSIIIVMVVSFFATIFLQAANAADMTIEMLNKRDDGAKMVYGTGCMKLTKFYEVTLSGVFHHASHNSHVI